MTKLSITLSTLNRVAITSVISKETFDKYFSAADAVVEVEISYFANAMNMIDVGIEYWR